MSDRSRTHWETCYRDPRHHECAMAQIGELEAENERLRKRLDDMRREWGYLDQRCDRRIFSHRGVATSMAKYHGFDLDRRLVGPWEPVEGEEVGDG